MGDARTSEGGGSKKSDDSGASSDSGSGDSGSSDSGGGSEKAASDEGDEAGTIKEKPGGCGCRLEDNRTSNSGPAALLAALVALGVVLRRRARA